MPPVEVADVEVASRSRQSESKSPTGAAGGTGGAASTLSRHSKGVSSLADHLDGAFAYFYDEKKHVPGFDCIFKIVL